MKKIILGLIVVFSLSLFGSMALFSPTLANGSGSRKIIVFRTSTSHETKDRIIKQAGGTKIKDIDLIGAQAVSLPSQAAIERLKTDPSIVRVDEDVQVFAQVRTEGQIKAIASQPPQTLPWGIDRIDAELVWPGGNIADTVKVGIIDTGISNNHPDLLANVKGGVNTINPAKSWKDDNGHGSHVAGIVAASNNSIGAVGVGPGTDLYAIKVLNAAGSGYLSDIIEGIQWAIANGLQVANLSLGTSSNVQSFHDAVIAAKNAGLVVVAAAGNSGGPVIFPAAYPEVIAVSATDQNNVLASWSSRGPEVDLAAPGVSIYSTYKGTSYATLSGTSMAAPHVTGAVALVLSIPTGSYDANGDGKWNSDEVQKKLQDRAVDLGVVGFDNFYGWGLVNAYNSTQP